MFSGSGLDEAHDVDGTLSGAQKPAKPQAPA